MYSQCKRYYDSSDSAVAIFPRRRLWIDLSLVVVLLAVFALPNRAWGSAAGRIYWTDRATHKVQCAGIDIPPGETPGTRSDTEDLTTGLETPSGPYGIAVDSKETPDSSPSAYSAYFAVNVFLLKTFPFRVARFSPGFRLP